MNPVKWWFSLPSGIREPVQSFVVSTGMGLWTATTTAVGVGWIYGHCNTFPDTLTYLGTTWWFIVLAAVFGIGPFYRAKQGAVAAANTVQLAGGASAVITPSKGP